MVLLQAAAIIPQEVFHGIQSKTSWSTEMEQTWQNQKLQLIANIRASYGFQLTLTYLWKRMFNLSQVICLLTYTLLKHGMWHSTTSAQPPSFLPASYLYWVTVLSSFQARNPPEASLTLILQDLCRTLSFACFSLIMWNHTDVILIGFLPYGCLLKEICLSSFEKGKAILLLTLMFCSKRKETKLTLCFFNNMLFAFFDRLWILLFWKLNKTMVQLF